MRQIKVICDPKTIEDRKSDCPTKFLMDLFKIVIESRCSSTAIYFRVEKSAIALHSSYGKVPSDLINN